jgi:hypothetical protein
MISHCCSFRLAKFLAMEVVALAIR